MRLRWFAGGLIVAALLQVACLGSGEEQDRSQGTTAIEAFAPTEGDPTPLVRGAFGVTPFNATYQVEWEDPILTFQGTLTWYQDGSMERGDFVGLVQRASVDSTFINDGTSRSGFRYLCHSQQRACAEFAPDHFDLRAEPRDPIPEEWLIYSYTALQLDAGSLGLPFLKPVESTEIAGEPAHCFDFERGEGHATVCSNKEGIMLSQVSITPNGRFEFRATSFEHGVPEDIFEPPFPVAALY